MIKKICNRKIDEIDKKFVDILGGWNKIEEKVGETKIE